MEMKVVVEVFAIEVEVKVQVLEVLVVVEVVEIEVKVEVQVLEVLMATPPQLAAHVLRAHVQPQFLPHLQPLVDTDD